MSGESLEAVYVNMYLLALADGRTDPTEIEYLRRFCEAAGIGAEQAAAWRHEVDAGQSAFREIEDPAVAREYLGIMARMVRVDGVFDESEQAAYIAMGKTLGFDHEQLGEALREHWDSDPLERFAAPAAEPATAIEVPGDVVIVQDDMVEQGELTASASGVVLTYVTMNGLGHRGLAPKVVLFHVAEDKQPSSARLAALKQAFPDAYVAFVAGRHQAFQIGYLLEQGADRCFVEPLYPGELAKGIREV